MLAGAAGRTLEWAYGTPAAAALIYLASDPQIGKMPNFYCDNETALADMKERAEKEATLAPAVVEPVSGAVPDGWKLVPIDPSDEYAEKVCLKAGVCGGIFESVHSAMLAAAPEPAREGTESAVEKAQGDDELLFRNPTATWDDTDNWLEKYARAEVSIAKDGEAPIVQHAIDCCRAWVPEARLIGNVMAGDLEKILFRYYQHITERREPPADLSIGKQAEQIYEWCACLTRDDAENQIRGLLGRISGVSKEGEE